MTAVQLPVSGIFTGPGSVEFKGGSRTIYAWGDFAGGRLIVRALVPHSDGDELFDVNDEGSYVVEADPTEAEVGGENELLGPSKQLELTSRGYMIFSIQAPLVRVELVDCDDTPSLRYWIG